LLSASMGAAVCGRLGDLYGRKRLLMIMLALAAIGSVVSAMSSTLTGVIAGRVLQGASMSILPLCYGLVRETWAKEKVPLGVAILAATYAFGTGIGFVAGGLILDHLSWHWIFACSATLASIAFVLSHFVLPMSPRRALEGDLDLLGGVLFAPAVAGVLLGITQAKTWGWMDPRTIGLILASLLLLALWARHELRHPRPLLDVRLLANRRILLANAAFILLALGPLQLPMVLMLLLQQPTWTVVGLGITATVAGMFKLPSNVAGFFFTTWSGYVATKHGTRVALLMGAILVLVGQTALVFWHGSPWIIAASAVIAAAGQTAMFGGVPNVIVEAAPEDRTSEATGMAQVIRSLGMAIGTQTITFMLAMSTIGDPARGPGKFPTESAYTLVLGFMAVTALLSLVCTVALPRHGRAIASRSQPVGMATPAVS
jgi:MFS family permease